jgi:hypothetical protein
MDAPTPKPRIPDGRKMLIYERFWHPAMTYTIEQVYAYIEREAPDDFRVAGSADEFQRKVLAAFPVNEEIRARLEQRAKAMDLALGVELRAGLAAEFAAYREDAAPGEK